MTVGTDCAGTVILPFLAFNDGPKLAVKSLQLTANINRLFHRLKMLPANLHTRPNFFFFFPYLIFYFSHYLLYCIHYFIHVFCTEIETLDEHDFLSFKMKLLKRLHDDTLIGTSVDLIT